MIGRMSVNTPTANDRPTRWGLAAKLFVALLLLGAIAILVTGILGYVRGRDALEESIYNQLTAARRTKARQVESYFRATQDDLRLLAHTRMLVEAARDFRKGFEELEKQEVSTDLRQKVEAWYEANYMPTVRRLLGKDVPVADYRPNSAAANYLQYHYIAANPQPMARRRLLDDPGDGSAYSAAHAIHHPLLRTAAFEVGFIDLVLADARTGRVVYSMAKEVDFSQAYVLVRGTGQCIIVAKDGRTKLDMVNRFIDETRASGKLGDVVPR